ncbi:MAG: adenylate kinase [Candidatus Gastranaerophilales bacterium]|nr:adenylate kinase [Candidatus Gastranaerophilales bacterium]
MIKSEMIFLGPPASGKGTQTERLAKELNLPHIDTGSLLRAEIAANSKEGQTAKGFMDNGQLVPAELVAQIIIKKIFSDDAQNGYILDGFPRSIEQAEILENELNKANKDKSEKRIVIKLDVDEDLLLERIINRRMCKGCGKIYNLKTMPPKIENICDECGGELYQRTDDTKEVAQKRFDTYFTQTAPLVEYYENKGLLVSVDANTTPDKVYQQILNVIGK